MKNRVPVTDRNFRQTAIGVSAISEGWTTRLETERPGTSTRTRGLTPGRRDAGFAINISTEIGTFSAEAPPGDSALNVPAGSKVTLQRSRIPPVGWRVLVELALVVILGRKLRLLRYELELLGRPARPAFASPRRVRRDRGGSDERPEEPGTSEAGRLRELVPEASAQRETAGPLASRFENALNDVVLVRRVESGNHLHLLSTGWA